MNVFKSKRIKFVFLGSLPILFCIFLFAKLDNNSSDLSWSEKIVGFDKNEYDIPVKIAILDSGINKEHSDLQDVDFIEYNAISKKKEKVHDDYGHGTAIAGIIAAKGGKVKGILANPIIYDVKVINENGEAKLDTVIEGINWSIKNEVDIINISFGFINDRKDLKIAIEEAIKSGIIIIAAAGNTMGISVDYPAKYDGVLSIASLDENLKIDSYSAIDKVDYSAPGVDILSTNKDGDYELFSGTSFATAYATGIIASILKQENIEEKKDLLDVIGNYIVNIGNDKGYGKGLLTLNKNILEERK
ncbi:S8 family serine peptidase [Lysinibacillus sp. CD3-6]|uniref:S8 family peptidase n=1 Tax=Lysinibacillus sp. CD3-6 TaxID=2892541 RepID=UPI00116CD590|nr:S8 family serine peptidase [Lysinibacillus sp. CD3-6]UED82060.1 S8 family serine peptidase [Lysinibacillus sp. CD3-6]